MAPSLLVQVGAGLTGCVRQEDTVARLGGDEFAVLLADAPGGTLTAVTARVTAQLGRSTGIGGVEVAVRSSVGAAAGRPGTDTAEDLLRRADLAMYAVKRTSRTPVAEPVAQPVAVAAR
jgi:diguanylate cyclase (GGDEF)-like protein